MKNKKVLFIVPFPLNCAPSQRLKFEQYFDYFRDNGIEIEVSAFVSPRFRRIIYKKGFYGRKIFYTLQGYLRRVRDVLRAKDFDVIYLHLEAAPFGPPVFEYIFSRIMRKPVIYDIDDVIYLPHASSANNFIKFLRFPRKIPAVIKLSSHVIVVTEHLKQFALRYNKNVTYIPPTIDTDRYFVKGPGTGKVCVGWTGSHSTSQYLMLIRDVLLRLAEKYDISIKVFGDKNFRIEGLDIEAKDWSADTEVRDIQAIDIGLYPLPDTEWVLGKGGLKALQYMGMGIPAVCTRIGAVLGFIEDGVNGFLVSSEPEWTEAISRLIRDAGLRSRTGLAARKTVEERFSVKVNAPAYLSILRRF